MDNSKRLQNILFLYPMIFIVCSFTWHFCYWSTFDTNVIQLLSIDQMIFSFVDSFSKFFYIYILNFVTMFYIFGFDVKIHNTERLASDVKYRTRMTWISNLLIIIPFIISVCIFHFYDSINKWLFVVIPIMTTLYFLISETEFLNETFPVKNQRRLILMTIIALFSYTICIAKYSSLRIYNNIEYDIVEIIPNQAETKTKKEYKLLGFASDYIVVSDITNKKISFYNKSGLMILNIKKFKLPPTK